jgi:NADPH:quinone reductase-like Zn-dependent oxidoreductase
MVRISVRQAVRKLREAIRTELIDCHALTAHVDKPFALIQVCAALQYQEKQSSRGKVVLKLV